MRGFVSQSGGLDMNCHFFEYLMMYLFDFIVIITKNYQIFQFLSSFSQIVLV